jgi:hypothetical protein
MRHNPYYFGRRGDEFYYAQLKPPARLTQTASAMDIGPQMCARYSLTKEQITMLIGEIEVIINIGARGDAFVQFSFRPAQPVAAGRCQSDQSPRQTVDFLPMQNPSINPAQIGRQDAQWAGPNEKKSGTGCAIALHSRFRLKSY